MAGLTLAQDADADALLARDPLALLVGMLLDQQIPMERAFVGPHVLAERLGRDLDAHEIAAYDPDALAALFARPPAIHRFPGSMAGRVQALCRHLVAEYDGDAPRVWREAADGGDLLQRLAALPGFGKQKAQIFTALLGKQLGVQPRGWREAAGEYGEQGSFRSVADVTDAASLAKVREYKAAKKRQQPPPADLDVPAAPWARRTAQTSRSARAEPGAGARRGRARVAGTLSDPVGFSEVMSACAKPRLAGRQPSAAVGCPG